MDQRDSKKSNLPIITGISTFILILALTQYLSYQQYLINKKREHDILLHELSNIKDKFRSILYNDITAANSLVIMYKQYGDIPKNFDTIAQEIIKNSKYVEAIQLTKGGVITNVYPLKGYENTIGINSLKDKMRQQEAQKAITNKEIYFAGPRKLRQGGIGILGKVPIIINNKVKGYCVVLTKLPTIKKALETTNNRENKFTYILTKNQDKKDRSDYLLTDTKPNKNSEYVSIEIPEGNWILSVAYSKNFARSISHYKLSLLGILLSIITALLVYRKAKERETLQKMVREKTLLLQERVKELSTIYKINNLLLDEEQSIDEMFTKVVHLLPTGWQYPEICESKIYFENKNYQTKGYRESIFSQKAYFQTADNRKGVIEIIYTKEKNNEFEGPFFQEERDLINSIANMIEIYLDKKNQKEALNQSETLFRVAFEMASIGIAIVSLEGKWLKVNVALSEMLGYSEEEFSNLNFQQVTHSEDLEKDLAPYTKLLNGEKDTYRIEKRYIHKNGSIVWVNLNVVIIKDNNNKPLYFVSQIENITERVESQNKFKDLVEKSLVGIYILKDGKMAYANPEILKEYGYLKKELIGQPVENLIYEEDLPTVRQKIQERLLGIKDQARYEIRIKRKDGSLVWNEMFGVSTIYEGQPAIIGTMVNITDKKNFYDELQKSEANLRSIFDSTEVSYLLVDKKTKVISHNQHYNKFHHDLTGKSLSIGIDYIEQLPFEKQNNIQQILSNVLANETSFEYEEIITLHNENLPRYYNFIVSPVKSKETIIGACIAIIEITSKKNLEIERQKIIRDLTQKNRDLEQFSYIVSHNIRSHIARLLGLSVILKNDLPIEEQIFINQAIKNSATELDEVINDVNEILNVRKDFIQSKTEIDLYEIITKIETELENSIIQSQARISYDFSAISTFLSIKPYIHSIFFNLVSNSIKYTAANTIPEIKIWSKKEGDQIVIYFKDNGKGIDLKKYGSKIFGLYQRFDLSKEGKGLGLFMVKTQISALNGTINLESEPEKGLLYIITLPIET